MLKLAIALGLIALVAGNGDKPFENYKVFRVTPTTEEQTLFLHHLHENSVEYNFWKAPSYANASTDLMVAPEQIADFEKLMRVIDTPYETYVENVQTLIDNENPAHLTLVQNRDFDWKSYHTYDEITVFLKTLVAKYPGKLELIVGGKSYEGRDILGVKLSYKKNNPGVFIEGGIHAREWISPATVTYILNEFLTSQNSEIRQLVENNDWYIFPVFNPDGYAYTHSQPTHRFWRKTRKPSSKLCHGADANRNWDYKWMQGGASNQPCSETYAGTAPFSEIETKTLSEYITSISGNLYAYISFHSYSQLLLFPYGHTSDHLDNYDDLLGIGKKTIAALAERYGTRYVTGNIAETIYIATGSTVDWAKGTLKLPLSYIYELRDKGKHGFVLPADEIIPTGEEIVDSLVALFKEASVRGIPKKP